MKAKNLVLASLLFSTVNAFAFVYSPPSADPATEPQSPKPVSPEAGVKPKPPLREYLIPANKPNSHDAADGYFGPKPGIKPQDESGKVRAVISPSKSVHVCEVKFQFPNAESLDLGKVCKVDGKMAAYLSLSWKDIHDLAQPQAIQGASVCTTQEIDGTQALDGYRREISSRLRKHCQEIVRATYFKSPATASKEDVEALKASTTVDEEALSLYLKAINGQVECKPVPLRTLTTANIQ